MICRWETTYRGIESKFEHSLNIRLDQTAAYGCIFVRARVGRPTIGNALSSEPVVEFGMP